MDQNLNWNIHQLFWSPYHLKKYWASWYHHCKNSKRIIFRFGRKLFADIARKWNKNSIFSKTASQRLFIWEFKLTSIEYANGRFCNHNSVNNSLILHERNNEVSSDFFLHNTNHSLPSSLQHSVPIKSRGFQHRIYENGRIWKH